MAHSPAPLAAAIFGRDFGRSARAPQTMPAAASTTAATGSFSRHSTRSAFFIAAGLSSDSTAPATATSSPGRIASRTWSGPTSTGTTAGTAETGSTLPQLVTICTTVRDANAPQGTETQRRAQEYD